MVFEGEQGQHVKSDNAEQVNEGDNLYPDVAAENARVESNSDDDSDNEEFIPSDLEVDSADDAQFTKFTDSEEEYDDESGFEDLRGATDSDRVDKGKGVVNGNFSDEEGFNSDEVDLDYEVGGGSDKEDRQDDDNDEATRYPTHKDVKDMTSYKWEVGTVYASREEFKDTITAYAVQTRREIKYAKLDVVRVRAFVKRVVRFAKMSEEKTWQLRSMNLKHTCSQSHRVGIMHTTWLSKAFKKKVEHNPKFKIKDLVNKAQRKWNLTMTTSMEALLECSCRKWQLSGIPCTHVISCINCKGLDMDAYVDDCYKKLAYVKCYESVINPLNGLDLWEKTNFDDVMPPPYRKPSHKPVKKRKRGPDEVEDRSQSHLSRRGQIQRCSNCGELGHKRGGCKKPPFSAQPLKQPVVKRTNRGRKTSSTTPITRSKASSQPAMQPATRGRKRSNRQQRSSS
ncbi:hypothetical protein Ahy_B05g079366 [Arachis hypogaea]|uniref:SWIM-type domain-containing protein n=1 Tax=Arachis hypogaea TaxID=3818 RepID=A0A444Z9N8_ARAHY|nr:hypothetical protein Ahy_B05g079366 [Arachis hypogaea]